MDGNLFLRSRLLAGAGAVAGFSTRTAGDRDVAALGQAAGFDPDHLYMVTQVHGAAVVRVGRSDAVPRVRASRADALVTTEPGLALAVRTADCVPVLLAHRQGRGVAAAHAGWRGVVAGVLAAVVAELARITRAEPSELVAAIGPAIGPCCYEVGEEVARAIADAAGTDEVVCEQQTEPGAGKPHVDLRLAASRSLVAAGLDVQAIELIGGCTFCERELYSSFRRDGERAGRQVAFVFLESRRG